MLGNSQGEFYVCLFCMAYFIEHHVFKFMRLRVACIWTLFLFVAENIPFFIYTIFCLPIHLWMDTWVVSTFWLLWIFFPEYCHSSICLSPCFQFWGHMARSRIAGFCDNSVFHFMEQPHCHRSCTMLHPPQPCTKVLMSPPLCQHMFFSVCFL